VAIQRRKGVCEDGANLCRIVGVRYLGIETIFSCGADDGQKKNGARFVDR
jgi:hypothetical protein